MRIVQINTVVNSGSTGRICEELGKRVIRNQGHSYIGFGRGQGNGSQSKLIRIGTKADVYLHVLATRLLDYQGRASKRSTKTFVKKLTKIKPDVVHLHNIHGYFLNYEILCEYFQKTDIPIVWTLHDCWPFTGHCCHFEGVNCFKWQSACNSCPAKHLYPKSIAMDNSASNWRLKRKLFTQIGNLNIITPSTWLAKHVNNSFLSDSPCQVIHNGINISSFRPLSGDGFRTRYKLGDRKIILGVANIWDRHRGLDHFHQLSRMLKASEHIVLIGLARSEISELPKNVLGIARTESVSDLAHAYSAADVYVNPTLVDNFPTTNIEALACGTPVVTYDTGGSPESIDANTGYVAKKGDVQDLRRGIDMILSAGKNYFIDICRTRAVENFDMEIQFDKYVNLYRQVLAN